MIYVAYAGYIFYFILTNVGKAEAEGDSTDKNKLNIIDFQ